MERINDNWLFSPDWENPTKDTVAVRLPHNPREIPLHYADKALYEGVSSYERKIVLSKEDLEKRLFLQFDGAAHIATVFVNDKELGTHRNGYTAFRLEFTDVAKEGENDVKVRLDSTENPSIPPFGFVIDYLTYSGIYRDVWLDRRSDVFLSDVFVKTPTTTTLSATYTLDGEEKGLSIKAELKDRKGNLVETFETDSLSFFKENLPVKSWSPEEPNLYLLTSRLYKGDILLDTIETKVGFRTVAFDQNHFYLNGEKYFFRGLNRHQCWPYIGYAGTERMQRKDAEILKYELQCNAVRTSHYPQSHYFLDACDELGLLVFTEIPGWQHVGDEKWQDQAVENVREMVLQYRNHPSIFLWGVRINESLDNDAFYRRTNELCHALDDTRPTSGVRYLQKSSLLEDVYAYNDFSHAGTNPGVKKKKDVTKVMEKALFVSEANGHMYPTKPGDPWTMRQSQMLRHARVLNDAMASGEHAGCYQWCMFDYATHEDFGSGDRICYHGVLDSFRNPKSAAYLWASQGEENDVLALTSSMDIGDYPGGVLSDVYILSNGDEVKLYKNDKYVTTYRKSSFTALPHGPILMDDTIGDLLETEEGFSKKQASLIRECLLAAGRYGFANLPLKYLLKLGWCMLRYQLKYEDGVALYGKYVGNWGGEATRWKLESIKDGKVRKSVTFAHSSVLHLETDEEKLTLEEGDTYDQALVRVRVLDAFGNNASYATLPLKVTTTGPIALCGPDVVVTEGGATGVIIRTTGEEGKATLTLSHEQTGKKTVEIEVTRHA